MCDVRMTRVYHIAELYTKSYEIRLQYVYYKNHCFIYLVIALTEIDMQTVGLVQSFTRLESDGQKR